GHSTAWGDNNIASNTGQLVTTTGCLEGQCFEQDYPKIDSTSNFCCDGGGFVGSSTYPNTQDFYYRIWIKWPTNWVESINGSKVIYGENGNGLGPRQEIGSGTDTLGFPWGEAGLVNHVGTRVRRSMNL